MYNNLEKHREVYALPIGLNYITVKTSNNWTACWNAGLASLYGV